MTDAGFFRGTSADQDNRFSDKQKKLLKTMKFADELNEKVNTSKVKLDVLRPWVNAKVTALLGMEDEVVAEFVMNQLEAEKYPDGKMMQINLTGFLNGRNAREFLGELWGLLLAAQASKDGIPPQFVESKKEEIRQRKEEQAGLKSTEAGDGDSVKNVRNGRENAPNSGFGLALNSTTPSSVDAVKKERRSRSPARPKDISSSRRRSKTPERRRYRSKSPSSRHRRSRSRSGGRRDRRSRTPERRHRRSRSRSRGYHRRRSPSPPSEYRRRRSPSPERRRRRKSPSPLRKKRRSPTPDHRRKRSPPSDYRRRRSPSPSRRRKRSPSLDDKTRLKKRRSLSRSVSRDRKSVTPPRDSYRKASASRSPSIDKRSPFVKKESRSPSPAREPSKSPSVSPHKDSDGSKSRTPSPDIKQEARDSDQRSSPSSAGGDVAEKNRRSPSAEVDEKRASSREKSVSKSSSKSPSPPPIKKKRSPSKSPSRSKSRSRSKSPRRKHHHHKKDKKEKREHKKEHKKHKKHKHKKHKHKKDRGRD